MPKKTYDSLYTVFVDGMPTYPGFAQKIFNDVLYGPRIQRRLQRLLAEHPDGLPERGHDWYFGYLVCAYSQVHYGNKNLLNFTYVTFKASDSTFGVIRIQCALKRELGLNINQKAIRRALHIMNLKSEIRRVKPQYNWTQSNAVYTKENIISRNFVATTANEKWFTDISYLKYGNQQKAYISAVIDVYDKSIVSYVISKENNNQLVIDTIKKAFENNPQAKPIIHSDRGFQYTSQSYHNLSLKHQFSSSMSRPGKCLDNQPIESFWGTFKSEYYYRRQFESYHSLHTGIDSYINYYSNKRYVPKFGGLTPLEYRKIA